MYHVSMFPDTMSDQRREYSIFFNRLVIHHRSILFSGIKLMNHTQEVALLRLVRQGRIFRYDDEISNESTAPWLESDSDDAR